MVWVSVGKMPDGDTFAPDELTLSPEELKALKRKQRIEKVNEVLNQVGREMVSENPPGFVDFPEKLIAPVGLSAVRKIKVK